MFLQFTDNPKPNLTLHIFYAVNLPKIHPSSNNFGNLCWSIKKEEEKKYCIAMWCVAHEAEKQEPEKKSNCIPLLDDIERL